MAWGQGRCDGSGLHGRVRRVRRSDRDRSGAGTCLTVCQFPCLFKEFHTLTACRLHAGFALCRQVWRLLGRQAAGREAARWTQPHGAARLPMLRAGRQDRHQLPASIAEGVVRRGQDVLLPTFAAICALLPASSLAFRGASLFSPSAAHNLTTLPHCFSYPTCNGLL